MSVRKRAGFLPLKQISELVWDRESYEAGVPATPTLRTTRVLKASEGFHTCYRTDQHPEVRRRAFSFPPMILMKRKIFTVGQINWSTRHPLRSGHDPLILTEV
jgi:hypothetical protein